MVELIKLTVLAVVVLLAPPMLFVLTMAIGLKLFFMVIYWFLVTSWS